MSGLSEDDYKMIEGAVMETARGRWFLAEFARRNRHADTDQVLEAITRIETRMSTAALAAPAAARPGEDEAAVSRVRFGILEMADAIARTKAEIASIRADGEDMGRFEEASVELDAIVDQTEKATSDILASAETVQEVAWTLREMNVDTEACDMLDAKATEIYTACSFQDLTGQRTRKVIQVLRYLEQRVNSMGAIWTGQEVAVADMPAPPHLNAHRGPDSHLLNGPALPGQGLVQNDIDVMLGQRETPPPTIDPLTEAQHIENLRHKVEEMRQATHGTNVETVRPESHAPQAPVLPAHAAALPPAPSREQEEEEDALHQALAEGIDLELIGEILPTGEEIAPAATATASLETPSATAAEPALPHERKTEAEDRLKAAAAVPGLPSQDAIDKLNYVEKMALFS